MREIDAGPDGSRGPAEASAGSAGDDTAIVIPFPRRPNGIEGNFFRMSDEQQLNRIADLNASGVPWWLIHKLIWPHRAWEQR